MDEAGQERAEALTLEPVTVGTAKRRRALWGVLVATLTAAAALSVVSAGDDAGGSTRLPVALGAAGAEAAGAADAMFRAVTYVPGDDLPALGGTARAYRLTGTVDEAAVAELADALGLGGTPVHDGAVWRVAAQDGGYLEVSEGYGAMWWYSSSGGGGVQPGTAGGAGVESCVESSDGIVTDCAAPPTTTTIIDQAVCRATDGVAACTPSGCTDETRCTTLCPESGCGTVEPECPPGASCAVTCVTAEPGTACAEPSVGFDLPSEDEARQVALDLLAATGVDVDDAVVRVEGPYDAWYVTVEPRVNGVPTTLQASVTVGPMGVVRDASGFLGTVEEAGEVPVLDTRAAIDRANHQQDIPVPPIADGASAVGSSQSDAVGAEPGCSDEDLAADRCGDQLVDPPVTTVLPCKVQPDGAEICEYEPQPVPQPVPDPEPQPAPVPEPEPFEVALVDAEPALLLLGANDGSTDAYLVPAYRFTAEDGSTVDLPAVAEEALAPSPEPEVTSPSETPLQPPMCEVLIEEDETGSTHTVLPSPDCISPDPVELPAGEDPVVGVGYYVDVQVLDGHCTWISVEVGGRWWWAEMPPGSLSAWSTPTEGGTFTLLDADTAQFVGDAERTKTAILTPFGDGTERPLCD